MNINAHRKQPKLNGVNILAYRDENGRVAFLIPTRLRSARDTVHVIRDNQDLANLCPGWMTLDRNQTMTIPDTRIAVPVGETQPFNKTQPFYETAIPLSLFL